LNYFELFALPQSFDLDLAQLSNTFQSLQKMVHPDRFAHASSQEQLLAVQKSATVNDAYQTLKNALKRAEYLLAQRGTQMPSEQTSFHDTHFLIRQMELREMLAEIKFADDVDAALLVINELIDSEYHVLFSQLKKYLNDNNDESNIMAIEILRKLKFYQKLQLELERIEEQLFDD